VQFRRRRERTRRYLLILAVFVLLAVSGCAVLYSIDPRYARGRPRREPERARAKPVQEVAADKRRGVLPWPAKGEVVTQFGTITDPKYKTVTKSTGIDIATKAGGPVAAVDSGKVSFADIFMGYGRMIILDHGQRIHSIYSRLNDVKVKVGDKVAKGQTIALAGDTLHFEFRVGGRSVDPLQYLVPR
jgi:septal ring factor EnvC (AmiA/AmiB activator)